MRDKKSIGHFILSGLATIIANLEAFFAFAFLLVLFSVLYFNSQVLYSGSLHGNQFETMSAEEYVGLMKGVSLIAVPDAVQGWPKPEDIPYLLGLVESRSYAGSAVSERTSIWFQSLPYESTEGVTAVILLKAIKEGAFHPYMTAAYPPDKDEIIAWARAEMEKINAEQALTPR